MIDLTKVSACLITKDNVYPPEVLKHTASFPFGEILVMTNCDSPFRKHELFAKAKYDVIYYSDDDAICPIQDLIEKSDPTLINVIMKQGHYDAHINNRATMGLGWGSIFPKELLKSLSKYTEVFGEDAVFKRETERIFTYLNYPQNRIVSHVEDLPSAYADDRLWKQPQHIPYKDMAEERCRGIIMS